MAIGSTFLRGKASVALAAFASLLIMSISILNTLENTSDNNESLFTAGITGIVLFITAIAFRLLTKKIQHSEYTIQQQIEHTDDLQNIAQRIIETIQAGIVVIDAKLNILFINHAAEELLSVKNEFHSLKDIDFLYSILLNWQTHKISPETMTINLGINHDVKISFTTLTEANITSLMLFVEDERSLTQAAQQLKLASLGRLTSSIAHEIRNPLSAINHASQLLDESEHIQRDDQELLSIIQMNAQRIDQTINNILQFSQRKKANIEAININQWLEKFCANYQLHSKSSIIFNTHDKNIYCKIDPHHLQQIMTNLVDNGLRHSNKDGKENFITIETQLYSVTRFPYINIIDEGEGIDDNEINTVFEPFYTTMSTGSGLGLYLCKELCQANQADIIHFPKTQKQKSCFRLILCQAQ
jgi:two-component system sensor histidine kinase PilS (NtrC family)